ncbi:hypothetical protein BDN72DRAFT_841568 [Pluteus cervinus]|uniref:Uncharacterized protein n=1 Tax=Pluteus cervinus TaxID=181527 RepID=A0ACD3ASA3_9AGAR|nr:hypothetical protein BDN72DRAFT_841568 [Pluteus cervinus]
MSYSCTFLPNPLANHFEEVVARRQKIDDELQDLRARMHVLRVERNALCPIYCLSPELLSRIFLHVKNSYDVDYPNSSRCWTTVTLVSSYWREIALGYSPLWDNITFERWPRDARHWVERAKATQLSINAQDIVAGDLPFLISLLEDLPRIRRLSIPIAHESPIWSRVITKLATSPASCLEFLEISDPELCSRETPARVPENLFSDIAPRLRQLKLLGCNLNLDSPFFENLTHMTLERCNPPSPLRAFLTLLEKTPRLQAFCIRRGFMHPSLDQGWQLLDGRPSMYNTISLPFLHSLTIDSFLKAQGLSLLAHLILEPDTYIDFSGTEGSEFSPFSSLIQVEGLVRKQSSSVSINGMSFTVTSSPTTSRLRLRAWSGQNGPSLLKIDLGDLLMGQDYRASWTATLSKLPLSNLHMFHTDVPIPPVLFGNLDSLEFISIAGAAMPSFVYFLQAFRPWDDEEDSLDDPADRFGLPGLKTIQLNEVDFRAIPVKGLMRSLVCRKRRENRNHDDSDTAEDIDVDKILQDV